MKTQTIQEIEKQIERVEQSLNDFIVERHQEEHYGPEKEYAAQSLKAGIAAILTDISGLVKAHNKFVQLSTYSERQTINSRLEEMIGALTNSNYSDAANHLDELKIIVRSYGVRGTSETQKVLEERANQLNAKCSVAEENVNTTEKIRERAEQAEGQLQSSEEKMESLGETLAELQTQSDKVENLQNLSRQHHQSIEEVLTSAKSHKEIVDAFVQQIETRQQQLEQQQAMTTKYKEQLKLYEEERKEKLEEAKALIEQARDALGYTTSRGISAAFAERYDEDKGKKSWGWLTGSGVFLLGSIGVGLWWLFIGEESGFAIDISRMAVMSAAFSGAWFCAAQYVKYKNTMEDYGYKAVLAKSMAAFLDQFDGEQRERYLEIVLSEIHKDPLRKRHDVYDGAGQSVVGTLRRDKNKGIRRNAETTSSSE